MELQTWQELEEVFARLGQLARSPVAPQEFYRTVLDQSVRALSAEGGAVWLRAASGALQLVVQTGRAAGAATRDEQAQRAHQSLLLHVATDGHVVSVSPQSASDSPDALNLTDHVIVFGPIKSLTDESQNAAAENGKSRRYARDHRNLDARRRKPGHLSRLRTVSDGRLRSGGRLSRL